MTNTLVYLDNAPENCTDELALHAVRIADETWNGWAVPIVTAVEFCRFVSAWAANDPNGDWRADTIDENDGLLSFYSADGDSWDHWPSLYPETSDDGAAVYALDGWVWTA